MPAELASLASGPMSAARCELRLPPSALAGCVRAVLVRDTTGIALGEAQRCNHFPATPLVSLVWWLSGRSETMAGGDVDTDASPMLRRQPMPDRFVFAGPFTRPSVTYDDGPVHVMQLMLLPDALQRLTGIDPLRHVNRLSPADEVLPAAWRAMGAAVAGAAGDEARWREIDRFLRPLWAAAHQDDGLGVLRFQEWAQGLSLRAAMSPTARSLRQAERRIKRWAGLPMRQLKLLSRAERAFFAGLSAQTQTGRVDWAALAAHVGYTDQSHLCRETRRVTGFSPEELRRHVANGDESFWVYRLWR